MTDGVKNFLSRLGLDVHFKMFIAKGFDSEDDLPFLNDKDLDCMYISDAPDRSKILQAALNFKPSKEFQLYKWLHSIGLDHYFINFIQSELVDLMDISRLNLPDESLYDELEITLPGHKRRLERAADQLSKKHYTTFPSVNIDDGAQPSDVLPFDNYAPEIPVAFGKWGKPKCLQDAKYDFLIVDATVVSTRDPRDRVEIEFMVDSGSDVVTIRQEVLDSMDLELIGPIHSKGVHASKVTNIYRANLQVGNEYVEVEVMGESYDSIGSRVIRHFRHYINGSRHIWLKHDFVDPTIVPDSRQAPGKEQAISVTSPAIPNSDEICMVEPVRIVESLEQHNECPAVVEETDIELSREQTILGPYDPNVQKDSVKLEKKYTDITRGHTNDDVHDDVNNDETDKMHADDGQVIDVQSFVTAYRKRNADTVIGLDPELIHSSCKENGQIIKRKRTDALFKTKDARSNKEAMNGQVHTKGIDKLRTVLKQRSVYYRSHVRESVDS